MGDGGQQRTANGTKPITVTRAELDWARAHPLALFDRMLLDAIYAARRERATPWWDR